MNIKVTHCLSTEQFADFIAQEFIGKQLPLNTLLCQIKEKFELIPKVYLPFVMIIYINDFNRITAAINKNCPIFSVNTEAINLKLSRFQNFGM